MSVPPPCSRARPRARFDDLHRPSLRAGLCAVGAASLWLAACNHGPYQDGLTNESGPCGRGKARACQCDDGAHGIAQCLVGGDWGECYCPRAATSAAEGGASRVDASASDGRVSEPLDRPKSNVPCDQPFDLRAHAAGRPSDPYLIHGGDVLGEGTARGVCFYFSAPYPADSQALAFVALTDAVSRPDYWLLYGVDASGHVDGDVVPCPSADPDAYLLAGFSPGSDDIALPGDVGLALPDSGTGALILEVHYADPGPVELLDRTGVRLCTASAGARPHTAATHFTGTEAICVPPAATDYQVSGVCSPRTDLGRIHLLSVWPRMLQLGKRMRVAIHRKDGSTEALFDETVISPLQARYLAGDVTLEVGDTLETSCFYDNRGLLSAPFGSDDPDALCYGFVNAWPAGALSPEPTPPSPFEALSIGNPPLSNRCVQAAGLLGPCL